MSLRKTARDPGGFGQLPADVAKNDPLPASMAALFSSHECLLLTASVQPSERNAPSNREIKHLQASVLGS